MDNRNDERDRGTMERVGEQLGAAAGNAMGRGADMAADMFGSLFGSAMGALGNWWNSADAQRAARSFDENRDRTCRDHFQSAAADTDRKYDQVRPLYQFGHMARQNPEFRGRDFSTVEPHLQETWETSPARDFGEWPEVRGYVGFGFSQEDRDTPRDI